MDNDKAWEVHDELIDNYFNMREALTTTESMVTGNPQADLFAQLMSASMQAISQVLNQNMVSFKEEIKREMIDTRNIITEQEISTQEELTAALNNLGYNVSQATVSRDINQLNLIKIEGVNKKSSYHKPVMDKSNMPEKIINLFKEVTISINSANNLVIVKTLEGSAQSVGMTIDGMNLPEILGTVAGDDTLLIITKTNKDADSVLESLRSL